MFGLGGRATGVSRCRLGVTEIKRPSSGRASKFEDCRAGDFFTYQGKLYFKLNLVDSVEIPSGNMHVIGIDQFSADCQVYVENVEISIK